MAEYEFKPGNIEDAITKNGETFSNSINVLPTEEEKEQIAADVQQEQEENYAKLDDIMASGQPVRRKMPDLVTLPKIYGNSLSMPEATRGWDDLGAGEKLLYGAQEKLWDVYRNLTNGQAHVLSDARRYAPAIGVTPQYLVDNPDEMERARLEYDRKQKLGFMPVDENYSSGMLDANYPELKDIRLSDPVGAAQALQNYQDVHGTRNIFDNIHDTIFGTKELFLDAFNSGSDMVKLYDAQMKAVKTGDVEAARPEVDEITQRLKEYHEQDEPTTPLGKVVYDTIQQLTIYGTQGLRALQYVPKGMAMAMAAAAPAAAAAGPETLGLGAAGILASAGITGALWGFRTGMFKEIQNQSMADRYWQMANAKDKNGKPMYSRNNMLLDSIGTGTINGAIELGLLELGYKPIKAAWGKDAAKAILTNGAAQRDIAEAGKGAIARIALTQGALQYGRGVASELAEEGAQSVVGSMAENIEYGIHGQGKWNTVGDVLNDAIDSMVQAVPAALGMGGMGAAVHTAGNYKAMNNIASIKLNEWKEEYKRNVEKQTIDQLIAQKKENNLAKEAPDVYQKVVDAQAKQVGMDTMYVDAQELARTEEGVNVLNDMVNKGIVSGEQVDNAVSNGTDLEIKTGVFAQLADETTDTKTLMDATTMNKGGVHMAALRERAKRIEAMRQELSQLASDKSDKLAEEIVQEHFKDADEPTQAAARDVVYRNPYDIEKSYKDAVKEARNEYENAINYKYYSTYKPQGVSVITADANGYNNTQTGRGYRMSNNEPWYSDMYKEYGGKATKEQLLDVAYKNERKEIAASSPELLQEWENDVAEKKARYETLKGMEEKFTALAKSDYALRNTFTKNGASVYTQALHILSNASEKASQAAKENAFIYARMAERWTNIMNEYGDTAYTPKKFMEQHPIVVGDEKINHSFGQAMFDVRKAGTTTFESFMDKISNRKQAGKPANKIMFTGNSGVIYTEAQVVHATTPHHGHVLSTEQLEDIDKHIDILQNAAISDKRNTNNFHGIPILAHVKGSMGDYYIVLELDNKGKIWFKTGQPGKAKSIDNIINTKIAEHSARSLSHNAQGRTSQNETAISLSSIQNELVNVNKKYEQRAWHGSPHDFDKFDLGYIGTGEGFNNHGYGLYFSKSKKIAQEYKKRLGKNIGKLYEAEIPDEKDMLNEDVLYKRLPQSIKNGIKKVYQELDATQKNIFTSQIIEEDRPTVEENKILNQLKEIQKVRENLEMLSKGEPIKGLRKARIKKELIKANFKEEQIEQLFNDFGYAEQIKESYLNENAQLESKLRKKQQLIENRIQIHNNELKNNLFDYLEKTASGYASGRGIYHALSEALDGDARKASALLNKNGIKGIIYDGRGEGRCYVVFDDKAISIIDKHNQDGAIYEQRAWHGSPYNFDTFDLGAMGKGEGNQAHGWGLYFAKDRNVSEAYKEVLGDKNTSVEVNHTIYRLNEEEDWVGNGNVIEYGSAMGYVLDSMYEKGSREKAIADLEDALKRNRIRGVYADEARKAIEILKEGHIKLTKNDRLYKVEIPENDVLLDEQKTIGEQPQKVQDAIMDMLFGRNVNAVLREAEKKGGAEGKFAVEKALRYISEDESELEARGISAEEVEHAYNKALEYVDEELLLKAQEEKLSYEDPEKPHLTGDIYKVKELTGKEFYDDLATSTPGYDKAASKLLNEYGIKGITYEGIRDGRCYVVFDDKAISIIDKYNQQLNGVKAAYDANTGAIRLFDAADQSSFIHEAGHMWLSEMKNMAMQEGTPEQLIKDLDILTTWGSYSPEKIKDYVGTNREKEFAEYAKAIEDARKSGDAVAIKAAEERWMQERFARAFERYIADGKAPVRELQGPFRKFKKWLVGIYQDLKNLGKEPPEDVKRVMDRMLATDEEIETWAKLREINAWDRIGFSGDLSGSEGTMIKKWAEKIREEAKEKLMQKYMEDIKKQDEADRQRGLEEEKIAYQKQLCEENELYKYENLYNTMPEARAGILAKLNIANEKEFRKALQEAGGTLEERTNEYMKAKKEEYDSLMYSPEQIRVMADEQLASTNGQIALNELEAHAMRRKLNGYIAECVKAMREVGNVSGTDAEVAAQLRNILHVEDIADKEKAAKGAMKDSILAKSKEIEDLKKRLAETKEKGKETKEQNERTIAQLKAGLNEVIKGLNDARDMGSSNYQSVLRLTREEMNDMTIGDATTWRHYEVKAKAASRRADIQMSAGNFTDAIIEKNNAQKFYCMSRVAKENEDFLRKALGHDYEDTATGEERTGIAGIINRIKRQKNPVRMGQNERYFIEHLAYILGLDNRDGRIPLDDKGNPVGINWEYLYRDLSPDNATEQKAKLNPDDLIAPWVRAMVERKDRIEDYQKNITMAQMRDIHQAIQAIYRVGKRDYEATTLMNDDGKQVSIMDAVAEMLAERDYSVDTIEQKLWSAEQEENDKTATGRLKDTLSDALLSLTKPEIVLNDMGKSFIKYIYKPIDTASRNEMNMLQQAYKEFGEIYNMYSKKEWWHIRQDKLYNLGRISNYTKEQVLAIALNWGNKEGRQRILDNLNEGIQHEYEKYTQTDVENLFAKVFTEKDLNFLEAVWKQIDQYWPERNKVQERLYGVGLGRVQATPYIINGRKVSGGYYPIVYDPKISTRTTDMELDDIVKSQLSGNAAMSIGMGSTKKRVKVVKGQVVMKSLNIWPQAVNEAIHHIYMREAVTDVYKLLNRKEMEAVIVQDYGIETYQMLKQWARDCWKTDIAKTDKISRMLETLRKNTSYSVMAYRASTAVLNALNIFPMMREIGFANTWQALKDVYITGNYKKSRQFVMEHSPFMAERINTLDKDFQQHMTFDVDKNASILSVKSNGVGNKVQYIGGIKDGINRFAYLAIAETDLMLSMPLWKWKYQESLQRQIDEGKTDELVMRDQATFEADRAVRNVLGSGMTKDQAQVQRTQGLVSQIIPFYSYCSTVMNALIQEGYNISAGKSKVGMWNAMLYWIVLPTIFEQLFRSAVAGDDWETLMKKMGVKMITNTTQGLPVVRDAVEFMANAAFDLPNYDSGNVLAISIFDELQKGIQSAGSKNQDATDVGRHLTRALNRYTGFSDTLTDGFWALMRFSLVDTDRSVLGLANSVIFDRRYKTAKEREKAEKQKEKKNTKQKDDKK